MEVVEGLVAQRLQRFLVQPFPDEEANRVILVAGREEDVAEQLL